MTNAPRPLLPAIGRGFLGRCPACGKGRMLERYLRPCSTCAACGEPLARYQAADFAPYLVTFVVGLVFTPITIAVGLSGAGEQLLWLLTGAALLAALLLLPRMKGAAIGLLWALDVANA